MKSPSHTRVTDTCCLELDEALARLELIWLFDRLVLLDLNLLAFRSDHGSGLNLGDLVGHSGSGRGMWVKEAGMKTSRCTASASCLTYIYYNAANHHDDEA
jgi:hypothetical protein